MYFLSLIDVIAILAAGIVGQQSYGTPEINRDDHHEPNSIALASKTAHRDEVQVANDWRQFRGPNGTGIESAGSPLPNHLSTTENLRWKILSPRPGLQLGNSCGLAKGRPAVDVALKECDANAESRSTAIKTN